MEDIELIIKIPDHLYKLLKDFPSDSNEATIENVLMKAVEHGTPLPKGHGELVDRNAINERFDSIYNDAINCSNQPSDKYLLDKLSMCLDTALPIIEADKEQTDG